MASERVHQQQKQLVLVATKTIHELKSRDRIAFALSLDNGRRVRLRRTKPPACLGARDFNAPLGSAADRTDLAAERGTQATRFSLPTERTDHPSELIAQRPRTMT
jgi:hypothetical protein